MCSLILKSATKANKCIEPAEEVNKLWKEDRINIRLIVIRTTDIIHNNTYRQLEELILKYLIPKLTESDILDTYHIVDKLKSLSSEKTYTSSSTQTDDLRKPVKNFIPSRRCFYILKYFCQYSYKLVDYSLSHVLNFWTFSTNKVLYVNSQTKFSFDRWGELTGALNVPLF